MSNVSVFCSYIQKLQPLFKIDPFLIRLFVKVTALEDLQMLISKVPSSILLMRLSEEFSHGYHQVGKKLILLLCRQNNIE